MSAFEELQRDGRPGPKTVRLLVRLSVQASTGFPPPFGHRFWNEAAGIDHVAAVFVRKEGTGFITACFVKARSQQELERLLLKSLRNDLIDSAKATPVGKVRRRLKTLLGADSRFVFARELFGGEDAWNLEANAKTASSLGFDEVLHLVEHVDVSPALELPPSGPTPGPAKAAILEIAHTALQQAAAALRAQSLARVVAQRFGLAGVIETAELPDAPDGRPDVSTAAMATSVFDDLNDQARMAIVDELDPVLVERRFPGEGRSIVTDVSDRLRLVCGTEDGKAVVRAVFQLCDEWSRRRS